AGVVVDAAAPPPRPKKKTSSAAALPAMTSVSAAGGAAVSILGYSISTDMTGGTTTTDSTPTPGATNTGATDTGGAPRATLWTGSLTGGGGMAPPKGITAGGTVGSNSLSGGALGVGTPSESSPVVRLRDVARLELGAQNYNTICTLDGR